MSLAAVLWAALLAVSAATHMGGMPATMLRAMRDLHLPAPLMRPLVGYGHLATQLLLAVGLCVLPAPWSWFVTVPGAFLALLYLVVVSRARGRTCRCLSRKPHVITSVTVLRNVCVLLLALASLGSNGLGGVTSSDWPAVFLFAGVLIFEAWSRAASSQEANKN